jgi:hypothetical protein
MPTGLARVTAQSPRKRHFPKNYEEVAPPAGQHPLIVPDAFGERRKVFFWEQIAAQRNLFTAKMLTLLGVEISTVLLFT